jgi:pyruvate dehydrogenase E1 component alpha subunit
MVGGGFGIAMGAAMRNKYKGTDAVAVCFFGDGAANEGVFHEVMNMASIWKLPLIFVNENNLFAESTPHWYASATDTIAERASAYNMPGMRVNGKDIVAVMDASQEAIARARSGEGPTLIECVTYRRYGHFEGDEQAYKAKEGDEKEWADIDPIDVFRNYVIENELMTEEELDEVREQSQNDLKEAVKFAQDSPEPSPESLYTDVFAD